MQFTLCFFLNEVFNNVLEMLSHIKIPMIHFVFPFSTLRANLLFQEYVNYMVHRFAFTIQQMCQQSYYPASFENAACNIPQKLSSPAGLGHFSQVLPTGARE